MHLRGAHKCRLGLHEKERDTPPSIECEKIVESLIFYAPCIISCEHSFFLGDFRKLYIFKAYLNIIVRISVFYRPSDHSVELSLKLVIHESSYTSPLKDNDGSTAKKIDACWESL